MAAATVRSDKPRKEKTIKSETSKVFFVVFIVLAIVGTFTVVATYRGYSTFSEIKRVQIPQFQAAEVVKQNALDIIGIFYLLAGETDINVQMEQMYRYDELAAKFTRGIQEMEASSGSLGTSDAIQEVRKLLIATQVSFDKMNETAREMTIANMEGRRDVGSKRFAVIIAEVVTFKTLIDSIEKIVVADLDRATIRAQNSLRNSMVIGVLATVAAVFVALGLIRYLMGFLSITLLPISNLMDNLRQAVFSIDQKRRVISPASKYTSRVFGKDIVGSDIFDLVFNSLGSKTEAYAGVSTALASVFDEDEMQWSLMEDNFPNLIRLREGGGEEKVLKMSYTPLFRENQTVQDVMIVAEDVTELEKAKREARSKQSEVMVIQGLVGVERGDLEIFLADTSAALTQCYDLIGTLMTDVESRKLLFRILHTIKGNARLYNLMTISEVVHVAESSVVEINNRLDASDAVGTEFFAQLTAGLRKIEAVLAAHSKVSAQLFGMADVGADRQEDLLYQNLVAIERTLSAGSTVVYDSSAVASAPLKPQYVLSALAHRVDASIETCVTVAKHFGAQEVIEKLSLLQSAAKADDFSDQGLMSAACEACFRLFFQSPRKGKYELEAEALGAVLAKFASLALIAKKGDVTSLSPADRLVFEQTVLDIYALADSKKWLGIRYSSQMLAIGIAQGWSFDSIAHGLRSGVECLLALLHIDASFAVPESERSASVQALLGQVSNGDEGILPADFLAFDVIREAAKLGVKRQEIVDCALAFGSFATVADLVRFLAGSGSTADAMSVAFDLIKAGVGVESNRQQYDAMLVGFEVQWFRLWIQSAATQAGARIDLYKVLANYLEDLTLVNSDRSEQSLEVSMHWYDRLNELVGEVASTLPEPVDGEGFVTIQRRRAIEEIQDSMASVFDYPIKALCAKMEPMMRDISKRLGKNINYVVSGDSVSMPRELAYALRDALVHMLRNSLDHGIEMPDARASAAKPDVATIEINCSGQAGAVRVIVTDDGAGINVEKVVAKALAMKAISPAEMALLTDMQKTELIYLSRLTTKEEVSSLSGRGVGMDAVRAIVIERMGGTIAVETKLGGGTRFTIDIPKPSRRGQVAGRQSEKQIFLSEARAAVQTCIGLLPTVLRDLEAGRKMFRLLHTLKGNATLHNLKPLAHMVHLEESVVAEMLDRLVRTPLVDAGKISHLEKSLVRILEAIAELSKLERRPAAEEQGFLDVAQAELIACEPLVNKIAEDLTEGAQLFQRLHTLKGNAQMQREKQLAEALHNTETAVSQYIDSVQSSGVAQPAAFTNIQAQFGVALTIVAKMRQAKSKKSHSSDGGANERDEFISDSIDQMSICGDLLRKIASNAEAGRKLFQIVHTMKSVAQSHGLAGVVEVIHAAETIVERISISVANRELVSPVDVMDVQDQITALNQALLKLQRKDARRADQRTDAEQFGEEVRIKISKCTEMIQTIDGDSEVGRRIFQILHTLKSNAQMFNLMALVDAIHQAEATVTLLNEKQAVGASVSDVEKAGLKAEFDAVVHVLAKRKVA